MFKGWRRKEESWESKENSSVKETEELELDRKLAIKWPLTFVCVF